MKRKMKKKVIKRNQVCKIRINYRFKYAWIFSGQLIEDEEWQQGSVNWKIYWRYIKAAGCIMMILTTLAHFGYNGCEVSANVWLSIWTSRNQTQEGKFLPSFIIRVI